MCSTFPANTNLWIQRESKFMKAILLASLAATAIQPLVFAPLFFGPLLVRGANIPLGEFFVMPLFAALFAFPFIVIIGIPSLIILRRFKRLSWLSMGAIGFIAAALPLAIFSGSNNSGYSSSGDWYGTPVDFVVNGQNTLYGWLNDIQGILFCGLHGLIGALVFYFVWQHFANIKTALATEYVPSN